jgi:spore maturation protein CgeB
MRLRDPLKDDVARLPVLQNAWGTLRRWQLQGEYASRREYYAKLARQQGFVYREADVTTAIRSRLANRGYAPTVRGMGEVHTFAFIPRLGWHSALYPDLEELGPVTEFDYAEHGYGPEEFLRRDRRAAERRREMNDSFLSALREAHKRRPVDWVFVYASGLEVRAQLIRAIVDELGIPVVNMCLDDKQSWTGPMLEGQHLGQVDIAAAFDLCWTSARVACEWYLTENARPIYMPEGFDISTYKPMDVKQDIPISFIGGAYGFRPSIIRYLKRHQIPIQVFGTGWHTRSVWGEEQVGIINRSVINLGMGGIGYSESLTNVKTRDFEIPGVGGGVYLTSFNPDLAQHFNIGQEILCYRNREEMLELTRYYLSRPEEARAIALRGRERCLAEHRWLHRYRRVCEILGVLAEAESDAAETQYAEKNIHENVSAYAGRQHSF